jgi:hypothetical protein
MKKIALLLLIGALATLPVGSQQPKIEPPLIERGRGYKPPTPEQRAARHAAAAARHGKRLEMQGIFQQALPAAFDCRDKGWVPPIGDQGQCGSCYLYSTIYGTLSSAFIRAGYGKPDGSFIMAVQYGMDCHNFGGCDGGNGTEVIDWVMSNGWPAETWVSIDGVVHKDYPSYSARQQSCRKVTGAKYWKPGNWGFVTGDQSNRPATTDEIKTALYNYGPLNVSLDAGGQFGNGTGTITSLGTSIDHEIELVAWDDAKDGGAFLLKNQWSQDWGNAGYRWCTYKACKNLVDLFWVSAGPLPPPPVPPVPPVPPGPGFPPIITSGSIANGYLGQPFSYQIVATESPSSFGASGLPGGLIVNPATGLITGTPTSIGTTQVAITAANAFGAGSAQIAVIVTAAPGPVPPTPGASGTITWTINGVTSQYELFPIGTRQKLTELIGPNTP